MKKDLGNLKNQMNDHGRFEILEYQSRNRVAHRSLDHAPRSRNYGTNAEFIARDIQKIERGSIPQGMKDVKKGLRTSFILEIEDRKKRASRSKIR